MSNMSCYLTNQPSKLLYFTIKTLFTLAMPKVGGKVPTRTYGQVIELELVDDLKKLHKPRKHCAYQIDVTWTDSAVRRVYR